MASHAWILLGCTLLAVCFSTQGLNLNLVRRFENHVCAQLNCFKDVNQENSYGISRLVILEIPERGGTKTELASIDLNEPNLVIQPNQASVVNGTGHISKSHVDVTLDFTSQAACYKATYVCQVESTGVKGKREVDSETVTPGEQSGDCTCSAITEQLRTFTSRADALDAQASTQQEASEEISRETKDLSQDLSKNLGAVSRLSHDATNMNEAINYLIQGHKETLEDIAALNRSNGVLFEATDTLKSSAEKRDQALAVQSEKDDANAVVLSELKQVDSTVTANLNERRQSDAQFDEYIKQLQRNDDSVNSQFDVVSQIYSKVLQDIYNQRQSDENQANDLNALKATNEAQIGDVTKLRSDFDTQVNQIKGLEDADANLRASLDDADKKNTDFDSTILGLRRSIQQTTQTFAGLKQKDQITENQFILLDKTDAKTEKDISELERVDVTIGQSVKDRNNNDAEIDERFSVLERLRESRYIQIASLRDSDTAQRSRISNLSEIYQQGLLKLQEVTLRYTELIKTLTEISQSVVELQHMLLASHVTVITRTTTKIRQVKCTRGMTSAEAREQVLVDGVPLLCDTKSGGGGYLVFARRESGNVRFDGRSWEDYKRGFGAINGDYWAGNEELYKLVSLGYTELRIDLVYQGKSYYAIYQVSIGDESSNYRLTLSGYSGDAGDSFSYNSGSDFSTPDRDNDKDARRNCAEISGGGGWWYNACTQANLNGKHGVKGSQGMIWEALNPDQPVTSYEMKLRNPDYEQLSDN